MTINRFAGEHAFLSNFAPSRVFGYPTVENAFQAMKAPRGHPHREMCRGASPSLAKKLGRHVELRPDWETVKGDVMLACLRAKFEDPELAEKLLATLPHGLVEGNTWHDTEWGVCYCAQHGGVGENKLGKLLMAVRMEVDPAWQASGQPSRQ